jgi:TolB-like protein/DNA-binding SARP family transcriptional activator/Tfp pilus assembly protein PilF
MGLSLKVLGEFEVRDASGAALSLPTRKTRALLGYLAVNADKPQLRDRLMALLWSDRGDRQARQSLNQALRSIRQLAQSDGVTLLDGDGEHVALRSDAIDIDAARFHASLAEDPAAAAALYDGPLLDGMAIPDPAFEEWLSATRLDFHNLACDTLERAAHAAVGNGDTSEAIAAAKRLVALDPLREDGHRLLMQLLRDSGDRAAALRQYQACADILQHELQIEPDAATTALFEEIRRQAPAPRIASAPRERAEGRSGRSTVLATLAAVLLAVVGIGGWFMLRDTPAPREAAARPGLALPDRPSIAVLPFNNLSGDPAQEYFSDGITEDLITDLSKVSGLFVIARNSSFAYKGRSLDLRAVGRELGVRYLLEGSVRKAGGRIRINAQFIDTETGGHVWAERFDQKLEDVFALQDEVTQKIVSALAVKLKPSEEQRLSRKTKIHPEAYDLFLRGLRRLRRFTPETNVEARDFFHEAMMADPRYARAIAAIGLSHAMDVFLGAKVDREKTLSLAERYTTAALKIDDSVPAVHFGVSFVNQRLKRFDRAIQAARRAIDIDTNYADGHAQLATALVRAGRPEEALEAIETALRLNPQRPFFYLNNLGSAHFMLGRYDEAARIFEGIIGNNPGFMAAHRWLAACYAHLGEQEKAEWEAGEVLTLQPDFTLREERETNAFRRKEDMERYIGGLRKAGLPE